MSENIVPPEWNDDIYLRNNPDVRRAIESGTDGVLVSGYDHYIRYGIVEGRPGAWSAGLDGRFSPPGEIAATPLAEQTLLPSWAMEEMLQQSRFEPSLSPEPGIAFPVYDVFNKCGWGRSLREACRGLRCTEYDYMFLLPWLRKGGADLASIFHIKCAVRNSKKVLVVITSKQRNDWLERLPSGVDVLCFDDVLTSIPLDHQALACYHLAVAFAPKRLHIINSHPGWKLLIDSAQTLSELTRIYVSLYCYDYKIGGEPVGYARDIRRCAQYLTRIFTDNSMFKRHLISDLGINPSKVISLRHPIIENFELPPPIRHSRRILWASRLDRQKRPHMLVEIAKRLPSLTFDAYGETVLDQQDEALAAIESCNNVVNHGGFDRLSEIASGNHRMFLYTSAWDGLPNIVLEALSAGMLVVTAAVGGIADDIGEANCILVREHNNPEAYVSAIRRAFAASDGKESIRLAGKSFVRANHTFEGFLQQLEAAGYIDPITNQTEAEAVDHSPPGHDRPVSRAASLASSHDRNYRVPKNERQNRQHPMRGDGARTLPESGSKSPAQEEPAF